MSLQRILVIGSGGAGKSTLARRLGERLVLPVIHLDACYWRAGWVETPKDEWGATVATLAAEPRWVMDGNYGGTLEPRVRAADTIVFLDLPRVLCAWRVLRRWRTYHGRTRPDMADGCPEQMSLEFLQWIWTYPATRRPGVLRLLESVRDEKRVVHLRSTHEVETFLASLPNARGA